MPSQAQQKYNKLAGKHVLVIGGTSGIGYCVAEASLASGAEVTVSSSSESKVKNTIEKLSKDFPGPKIRGFACDLSKPTVEESLKQLFEQTGKLDHIVFTAGDHIAAMNINDISRDKIIAAGQVRFVAPLLVAKVGGKYLNPGPESSITFTTGSVAEQPIADWSVVASYAAGLHGMTRGLALDLKPIRVNLVSPGPVLTELWDGMKKEEREAFLKHVGEKAPTGRIGRPEDVAESYLWLMKDSNVTGTVVRSDSGNSLV